MDKLTYLLLAFLCATVFIGCAAVTFSETGDTAEVKETTQKEKSTVTAETTEKAETTANTEAATTASNVSDSNDAGERVDGVKTIALSDNNISYSGSGIIALKNTVVINEGGSYALSGTLSDGKIIVDTADEVRLILSGVNITSSKSSAIEFIGTGGAVIEIAENTINRLSDEKLKKKDVDNEDAVIYSNSDITVTGGGRLDITGNRRGALYARNKLAVYDGIINIEKSYEGMESDGELIINGGNIHIISSDDALNAADNIVINGGYIYAESKGDGFDSNGDMSINGGEIYIFAANKKNSPLDVSDGDKIGN
ncbi:MAG: carbohydrate-binding domain-containing protein, partial [Oscillospiraceae bacterium]|nr:carbohydrate-binding domain-containing protein [Oscillospiraceae bacterium]